MKAKLNLHLSLCFTDAKDIEEVEKTRPEVKDFTNAEIYLAGLRTLAGMNKRAKGLV